MVETRSLSASEEMGSRMEEPRTPTMASKLSTSTKVNLGSINQSLKGSLRSKTLLAAEARTRSRTIITSKTQDRIRICREWSNLMGTAYLILNSSNRPARERSLTDRICCKNLTRARKTGHKKPRKFKRSRRMRTLNYRSRWGQSRRSSLRISLSIRRIFWNSLIVMKYMQN